MEITININEEKILELANQDSIENLPRAIYYEARTQAIKQVVDEIKSKVVFSNQSFNDDEKLKYEVTNILIGQLTKHIDKLIADRLKEENLSRIVDGAVSRHMNAWLDKKAAERLEAIKADLTFVSMKALDEEREAEAEAHKAELEALSHD